MMSTSTNTTNTSSSSSSSFTKLNYDNELFKQVYAVYINSFYEDYFDRLNGNILFSDYTRHLDFTFKEGVQIKMDQTNRDICKRYLAIRDFKKFVFEVANTFSVSDLVFVNSHAKFVFNHFVNCTRMTAESNVVVQFDPNCNSPHNFQIIYEYESSELFKYNHPTFEIDAKTYKAIDRCIDFIKSIPTGGKGGNESSSSSVGITGRIIFFVQYFIVYTYKLSFKAKPISIGSGDGLWYEKLLLDTVGRLNFMYPIKRKDRDEFFSDRDEIIFDGQLLQYAVGNEQYADARLSPNEQIKIDHIVTSVIPILFPDNTEVDDISDHVVKVIRKRIEVIFIGSRSFGDETDDSGDKTFVDEWIKKSIAIHGKNLFSPIIVTE